MRLPQLPEAGEKITEAWGRSVVLYLRSLLPQSTPTVLSTRTPSGTSWQAVLPRARPVAAVAAEQDPWEVYGSPDATGTAAWRTVRVHSGTINGIHPRSKGEDSFSDDTDVDDNGDAKASEMDMELEAGKTYIVVAVQTRFTEDAAAVEANPDADPPILASEAHVAWSLDKTYLFFVEDDGTLPFPGYPGIPDIFRNAYYRTIATVVTGSEEDPEAGDYQALIITPSLAENVTTAFVPPTYWEPVIIVADPDDAGDDEWRTAKIFLDCYTNGFTKPTLPAAAALTAGVVNYYWLKLTCNQDTAAATAAEIGSGTTVPVADEPPAGQAPAFVCAVIATLNVPSDVAKTTVAVPTSGILNYQALAIGSDLDTSTGGLIILYGGTFWVS